jgi:hypothetical protein
MSMTFRPGFVLPFVTVLAFAPIVARATQEKPSALLPPARQIIDRHIKEVGGREAILARTSIHVTGTVSMPAAGLTGTLEGFQAKPNKSLVRYSLTGVGQMEDGFDGKVAWSLSAVMGPMLHEGKLLEERAFDADFYDELKSPERYKSLTTVERTQLEGRDVYKIRLEKHTGGEDFELYDIETGLKAGSIQKRETPMGAMQATSLTTDYKKFGPLLQPTTTKLNVMMTQMIMTVTSVEYDKVDPAVFTPPAQIKALIK